MWVAFEQEETEATERKTCREWKRRGDVALRLAVLAAKLF